MEEFLFCEDLLQFVVFHGTSSKVLDVIMTQGLSPTDVTAAVRADIGWDSGSFWGTPRTATAYAIDTAKERHPGWEPVLLAAPISILEAQCQLVCDGATIDFPLKGLTRLEEPGVFEKWRSAGFDLPWRESLIDLGAIVALHDFHLDIEDFDLIESPSDLRRLSESMSLRGANALP
ncbi:hypothetical protein [Roseibium sp. RKSG952]|uniref:hypothetical protein n=1 Tax=Roseibium sp. RKSG952 TaxID=2529384 RepID=UPI0012BBE125|nr:hypothetical protein [Roseibium sp. RKSG952]MTH95303.1 hypothetical protein [Roseibium sp. RKSG952]